MPHLPRSALVAVGGLALLTVLAVVAFLTGHEGLGGTVLTLLVAGVGLMVVEMRARTLRSVRRTERSVRSSAAAMEQAAQRTLDRTTAVERRVLVALEKQAVEHEDQLARLSREAAEAARNASRTVGGSVAAVRQELDRAQRHL
ncbi:hypothetical protein PU560_08840, partial [Georgenia sp. 10Sc9-8]|nr:hypothetical protein [Georgenia halotolerans]